MRLNEGLCLRVKDVDFDRRVLVVRDGKGGKDRVVMLPQSLHMTLRSQLAQVHGLWKHDWQQQQPGVEVPDALAAKYPDLGQRWGWFWVFPSNKLSIDPRSRIERRHHLYEERLQRAIKLACAAPPPSQFSAGVNTGIGNPSVISLRTLIRETNPLAMRQTLSTLTQQSGKHQWNLSAHHQVMQ